MEDDNTASKLMNDEIKEILESLQYNDYIGTNDKRKLRDYITNLEQENQELKSKLECYENGVYFSSKVDELERENERLKEQVKREVEVRDYEVSLKEDYKSRIEKAVEYIKKYRAMYFPSGCGDVIKYVPLEFKRDYYENGRTFTETENLLDILNGKE